MEILSSLDPECRNCMTVDSFVCWLRAIFALWDTSNVFAYKTVVLVDVANIL